MNKKFVIFLIQFLTYFSLSCFETKFSQDIPFSLKDGDLIKIIDAKTNKKISCLQDKKDFKFAVYNTPQPTKHNGHQLFIINKINKKSKMVFNNDLIELLPLYAITDSNKFIGLKNKKLAILSTWHRGNLLSKIGITPPQQKDVAQNKKHFINNLFTFKRQESSHKKTRDDKPIFINDIVEIYDKSTNQKIAITQTTKEKSNWNDLTLSDKSHFFKIEIVFKPELDQIENISFQEILTYAKNQTNYPAKINSCLDCLKIFSPTICETNKQKLVQELKNLFEKRNKQNPQQLCLLRVLFSFATQKAANTDYQNTFENWLSCTTNELYPYALKSGDIIKIATIGSNKKRAWLNKNYNNNIEVNIDSFFNFQEESALFKLRSPNGKLSVINYHDDVELIPLYVQARNFVQPLNPYVKLAINKIFKDPIGHYLLTVESNNLHSLKNIFYFKPFPALNTLNGPVLSNTRLEIWNKATASKLYINQNKLVTSFQNNQLKNLGSQNLFVIEKATNINSLLTPRR